MRTGFLAVFLLFARLTTLPAARPDDDLYEPLAVGMRWESSVEITLPSGNVRNGSAVREIIGTRTIGERTYFVSVTRYHDLPGFTPLTTYLRKAADGIYMLENPEGAEYRETALPLTVGRRWTVGTVGRGNFHVEKEVSIVVAGQRYDNCLKVVFQSESGTSRGAYYLAPRIGIVLDTAERQGTRFRLALLSFRGPNSAPP